MNVLQVWFRDEPCGDLIEHEQGRLGFRYLDAWLEQGRVPVSLTLPLAPGEYGHEQVAPLVANLLPEGQDLRGRLERLLHVDARHDFGLISAIGRESAGALSFWPEGESPRDRAPGYAELDMAEFTRWVEFAHRQPLLFHGNTIRLSLAGVQSKTALYFDEDGAPFVPENGAATTHIIKPRLPGCQPSTVFVELLTMRLARAVLGADEVPETDVWEGCYRIRRFDRPREDGTVVRLHQEDLCLALGQMPEGKYEFGSPRPALLKECFGLIDRLGGVGVIAAPALERQRLLNQVILNVLLHNTDAHLKNYALLYDDSGQARIAPMYDALCTYELTFREESGPWDTPTGPQAHTRELSLRIGSAALIDQVSMEDWSGFARECGFTAAFVRRRVRQLAESTREALHVVIEQLSGQYPAVERAAGVFSAGVRMQLNNTA